MNWLLRFRVVAWIKRNWKDPVWSKVFASGIIFLIAYIGLFLQSVFQRISIIDSYEETIKFLFDTKIEVSLFFIALIGISSIILFLTPQIIAMIRNYKQESSSLNRPAAIGKIRDARSTDLPIRNSLIMHLDSSDISSLFQNFAGDEMVVNENQPVGLWKDKSGNHNHLCQVIPEALECPP